MTERKRELEKLKIKGGNITIRYHAAGGEGKYPETVTLEATEPPLEALKAALQGMAEHAVTIMEAPGEWEDELTVLSVTVTTGDELGLVITTLRKLQNHDAPLVLNTPHAEPGVMCLADLRRLEALAFDYVDGERAQRILEFETRSGNDFASSVKQTVADRIGSEHVDVPLGV